MGRIPRSEKAFLVLGFWLLFQNPVFSLSPKESFYGRYQELVQTILAPDDEKKYGSFFDYGYSDATVWNQTQASSGFWVYVAPRWYIWRQKSRLSGDDALWHGSLFGKYQKLLQVISAPKDETTYGRLSEYGYSPEIRYLGTERPAGYWVYSDLNWYIWAEKDFAPQRMGSLETTIDGMQGPITFRIEYYSEHQDWARGLIEILPLCVHQLEQWTKKPFPGSNPYIISESYQMDQLGHAGPRGMSLAPPPRGSTWTCAHELVHIWNAGTKPTWVCEGLANYLSYRILKDSGKSMGTTGDFQDWYSTFVRIKGGQTDYPINDKGVDNYDRLPQGKTLAFFALLHSRFGMEPLLQMLQESINGTTINPDWLSQYLKTHYQFEDSENLFSGWLTTGAYRYRWDVESE